MHHNLKHAADPKKTARPPNQLARDFDLNIEKVLEGWTVSHAVRELIANALDEQAVTKSGSVEITRLRSGTWAIRDYGRGLQHSHLTQNESDEKRKRERDVIGRFGVGLKDALAVLDRRRVRSRCAPTRRCLVGPRPEGRVPRRHHTSRPRGVGVGPANEWHRSDYYWRR